MTHEELMRELNRILGIIFDERPMVEHKTEVKK
jgi:hypothetical protein